MVVSWLFWLISFRRSCFAERQCQFLFFVETAGTNLDPVLNQILGPWHEDNDLNAVLNHIDAAGSCKDDFLPFAAGARAADGIALS